MLGVAHSFQSALSAGATVAEIARNAGQSVTYVRNHLALNKLPQELAEQIADGHLPMGTGIAVASIKNEQKRHGLAWFILSNPLEQMTAKAIKEVAKKLDRWNGLQVPLTCAHQAQRNIARSLTRLWHLVVDAYPVQSWGVIASFIYQGVNYQTPWADQSAVDIWFKTIGGEHYYGQDGIKWDSVVTNLMDEVSCEACPVSKLPERRLASDLSPGQSGVTGMPCRHGEAGPCLHGLAPNDPFHVRVPWDWAEYEGIEKDASGYVALSFDGLQKAWEAIAALEGSEGLQNAAPEMSQTITIASVEVINDPVVDTPSVTQEASVSPSVVQEAINTSNVVPEASVSPSVVPEASVSPSVVPEASVSPSVVQEISAASASAPQEQSRAASVTQEASKAVQKMRQQIAAYMQDHLTMNVDHPFATPCANCQHQLTRSPVKDKSAPHCAWAGRWREIHFSKLNPTAGKMIPVCRQFAPKGNWAQLIPAHPHSANMPREWIKHQIEVIVKRSAKTSRHFGEFLTGRPMKAGESYKHWFLDELARCGPTLSDEQLWTLMVWVLAESARLNVWSMSTWQKPDDPSFMIPADDKNSYFIKVSEIDFF